MLVRSVVTYWTRTRAVMGANPDNFSSFYLMQLACCYFTSYKELLYQNCVFFENLLLHVFVRPYCKWH
jgi:hypothetical protein